MLPQFHPGVRIVAPLFQRAKRCAIGQRRQHGATGEVDADAEHLFRLGLGQAHHLRHGLAQHLDVVGRVLQRREGLEPRLVAGQRLLDYGVFVIVIGPRHFLAGAGIHQQRPAGEGPEIDAEHVARFFISGFHGADSAKPSQPGQAASLAKRNLKLAKRLACW